MAYKNLIDNSSTTVTTATPGYTLDMRNRTTMSRAALGVPVVMKVTAASTAGDTGAVKLLDANGVSVLTCNIDNGGTENYAVSGYLPATLAKYDLHYGGNTLGAITIYSVNIYEYDVAGESVTGALSSSIGNFTFTSTGTVGGLAPIAGELSQSIGSFTFSSTGINIDNGALSQSIGNFSLSATGRNWALDATSGKGVPATDAELNAALGVAGLSFTAEDLYGFQEASGNVISLGAGTRDLVAGTTPNYQQAVTGWTRKGITLDENTADKFTTTIPSATTTSFLGIFYVRVTATPGATRSILEHPNLLAEVNTTPRIRANGNSLVTGTVNPGTTVHAIVLKSNIAGSAEGVYTEDEKLEPTWATFAGTVFGIGNHYAVNATAPISILWGAIFTSTNAEWSNTQIKTFLQTMGFTVAWTP